MTSGNHYAYDAIADWLHRRAAGLVPAAPGCREITMRPLVTGQLDHAEVSLTGPYGQIRVSWLSEGDRFELELDVPSGVAAHLDLPMHEPARTVGSGRHCVSPGWLSAGGPCPHVDDT